MTQLQLGQFHVGRLLSDLVLGLTRPNAVERQAAEKVGSSTCGEIEADTMPMCGSRLCSESSEAALRSVQRRWPLRYY